MTSPEQAAAAAGLFAAWQQLPDADQDAQFDALCVQHPDLAEHLHRLRLEARGETPPPDGAGIAAKPLDTMVLAPGHELRSALEASPEATFATTTTDQGQRYTVLGELGRGGMGVALRVFDTVLRRQLAMKVLAFDPELSEQDRAEVVARFVDEARVTGCLEHPGIVPVHDLHHEPNGRIFFTMPIIEGADLHEVIRRVHAGDAEWTMTRAVGVLLKVCEAVAFAHSRGVLHRDLTPANVRIGKFGEVHVIDWGLAKVLGRGHDPAPAPQQPAASATGAAGAPAPLPRARPHAHGGSTPYLTLHGTVLGTPAYMPPEQAEGRVDAIGPRADVYAAGALLYHLLAGVAPFTPQRRQLTPERVLRLVRRGRPPPVDRWNRTAPRELVAVCEKAMAREIDARYADMNAMAADLQAYVDGRVVPTFERGPWATLRKTVQRNRVAAMVVAAAVVAILFNLFEFGISHFRYRRLLERHEAELREARDGALAGASHARRADCIAAAFAGLAAARRGDGAGVTLARERVAAGLRELPATATAAERAELEALRDELAAAAQSLPAGPDRVK